MKVETIAYFNQKFKKLKRKYHLAEEFLTEVIEEFKRGDLPIAAIFPALIAISRGASKLLFGSSTRPPCNSRSNSCGSAATPNRNPIANNRIIPVLYPRLKRHLQ